MIEDHKQLLDEYINRTNDKILWWNMNLTKKYEKIKEFRLMVEYIKPKIVDSVEKAPELDLGL